MKSRKNQSDPPKDIEREKLLVERARVQIDVSRCKTDQMRATTERVAQLLEIVKYLNSEQEGERTNIDSSFEKISMVRRPRNLNGHEEDIYNAALIQIKQLIGFNSGVTAVASR